MKNMFIYLVATFCFFVSLQQGSYASSISGSGTLGSFAGDISYNSADAELSVVLTNTSPLDNGGYITAFAFNNPFNSVTGVSLTGTNGNFVLLGEPSFDNSISAMPYGYFDIGAGLSNKGSNPFQGGGKPQDGMGVGITETFTFQLSGTDLENLSVQDFRNELSEGNVSQKSPYFVVRFRGFNDGGGDKVVANPEPATIALLGIGIVGLAGGVARRKLKKAKQ